MKKILIAVFLLFPVLSFGQNVNDWIVLLLKNGNKVEGTVLAADDYKITVQTQNGQELTYSRTEINRMDKTLPQDPAAAPKSPYKDYTGVKSGFWWGAGLSIGVAIPYQDPLKAAMPVEADFALGYRVNEFFQAGVGFGYRYYAWGDNYKYRHKDLYGGFKNMALPLFVTLGGSMMPGRSRNVVPCWEVEGGYAFGEGKKVGGFFGPSIGLKFGPLERHHFVLTLGYLLQQTYVHCLPVDTRAVDNSRYIEFIDNGRYYEPQPDDPFEKGFLHALRLRFCYEF